MKKHSLMVAATVLVLSGCASEGILPTATAPAVKTGVSAISAHQGVGKAVETVLVEKPAVVTPAVPVGDLVSMLPVPTLVAANSVPLAPTLNEERQVYNVSSLHIDTSIFGNTFLYKGVFNGQSVGVAVGPAVSVDDLKRSTVRAALDALEELGFSRVSQQDFEGATFRKKVSAEESYYFYLPSTCDGCSREGMKMALKKVLNDETRSAVFSQRIENISQNYRLSSSLQSVLTLRSGWRFARLSITDTYKRGSSQEIVLNKEQPVFIQEGWVDAVLVSSEADDAIAPSSLDHLSDFYGVYNFSKEYSGRTVRWRATLHGNKPEAAKQLLNLFASKGFRREALSSENIDVEYRASTGPYWYGASSRAFGHQSDSGASTEFDLKKYFGFVETQISKVEGHMETSAAVGVKAYTINGDGIEKRVVFEFSSKDGKPHVGAVTFSTQSRDGLGEYSFSSFHYDRELFASFEWGDPITGYYDAMGRPLQRVKTSAGTVLVPDKGVAKIEFPVTKKSGVYHGDLTISVDSLLFSGKEYPVSAIKQVL